MVVTDDKGGLELSSVYPEFYVVGAPKCGTTALCKYLSFHPNIFIPGRKELHFFGSDLNYHWRVKTANEYLKFFESADKSQIRGDGSVWHLFSKFAADEIYSARPDAKIIIMLRNPVDLLYSLHSTYLLNGYESVKNFYKLIKILEKREEVGHPPRKNTSAYGLVYKGAAHYSQQIPKFLSKFGESNVKVILYEDFKSRTEEVLYETHRFLGVESCNSGPLTPANQSRRWRSLRYHWFAEDPPDWAAKAVGCLTLEGRPTFAGRYLIRKLDSKFNLDVNPRKPLDEEFRAYLARYFEQDIKYVETLTNRDLGAWRR